MATLREWFRAFHEVSGERPTHIVFGDATGWRVHWDGVPYGTVIKLSDVPSSIMDREFDTDFGGNESPNLCAWSPSWVLFSDNYDGAEQLRWVPRNPLDHEPIRPGGG